MLTEIELRMIANMTDVEHRFWAKTQIIDDEDSCWEWTGAKHPEEGRGQFCFDHPETGQRSITMNAARVAFYLTRGYLPVMALHTCDNPGCVRPKHLYDGTHADNMTDKVRRGRSKPRYQDGESNFSAKLTWHQVHTIRLRANQGETAAALAREFGVNRATLSYAIRGKTWKG